MNRRPRGKPKVPAKEQARAAVAYALRICEALGPVQGELRRALRLTQYELEKRCGAARQTIASHEMGEHGAGLAVLAALGYVLSGNFPRFAADLHRLAERAR